MKDTQRMVIVRATDPSTIADRFWGKVDRRGPDECWPWLGFVHRFGYGRFGVGGRAGSMVGAHQAAWAIANGRWPRLGMDIDHTCHNQDEACRKRACLHRRCSNPAHLEEVSHRENNRRGRAQENGAEQRAKTHCPHDHPYDAANTRFKRGRYGIQRVCRTCDREYMRRRRGLGVS